MKPKILIADDHPLILKGLEDFLIEKKYNVIGKAVDGQEAFIKIKDLRPEIAILDIRMPYMTGLEVAKKCIDENIDTKIVLITFEKDPELYKRACELNLYGYILKEFALNDIEQCIKSVDNNEPYFSNNIKEYLESQIPDCNLLCLTPTEREVLKLVAKGNTAQEIGELLFASKRTIEKHRSHIIKKLKLKSSQNSLLLFAKENEMYL